MHAPVAAAICAGLCLPPEALASTWLLDQDGIWNNASNWSGGIPNASGAAADFSLNFTSDRFISLQGPPAIQPRIGALKFDDTTPGSTLTIAADAFKLYLQTTSGPATFEVGGGNTLAITGATNSSIVLSDFSGTAGLTKLGPGTLDLRALADYVGPTTLTGGIVIASSLGSGGVLSSIGASDKAAGNLVFDGGTLRYVTTTTTFGATIDRSFQIGLNGATIDSSSVLAASYLRFGAGSTIATPGTAGRTLTLRGTNTGANEISAEYSDASFGGTNSLRKLDTGLWRLSATNAADGTPYTPVTLANYTGNRYSGDTVVQAGTLQLVFPGLPVNPGPNPTLYQYYPDQHVSVISSSSRLQLGSAVGSGLPGGGTLDMVGGQVQKTQDTYVPFTAHYQGTIQDFAGIVVNAGANQITRTLTSGQSAFNMPHVYVDSLPQITHKAGGTLRLSADYILRTRYFFSYYQPAVRNGWMTRDDDWVRFTPLEYTSFYPSLGAVSFSAYKVAGGGSTQPPSFQETDDIAITQPIPSLVYDAKRRYANNEFVINSLRFSGNPAAPSMNKQLHISDGTDSAYPDFGRGRTNFTLQTGGLLQTADSGPTQIYGGGLTSASGEFYTDETDSSHPIDRVSNGGTLGHSEIFAIVRSAATAPLLLSTAISDFTSLSNTARRLTVGLTKSGTGNLVLLDVTATGTQGAALSDFQGDVYINEGSLVVRTDHALGATVDDNTTYHTSGETVGQFGQTYLVGPAAVLDFQGVNYIAAERINFLGGEIRASLGRSSFHGSFDNGNKELKAPFNIGTMLEFNGNLTGVGGYRKLGAGTLVVNGSTTISSSSEIMDAGNLELSAGASAWNGNISLTNASLNVFGGIHSINGGLAIARGRVYNSGSRLALTKAGAVYDFDLQQGGSGAATVLGNINQTAANGAQVFLGQISLNPSSSGSLVINGSLDFGTAAAPRAFDLSYGFLTQVANVNSRLIPTTNFYGPAIFALSGTTITLNHQTNFNNSLTLGASTGAVNLFVNGLGLTSFKGAVSVLNAADTVTLANSTFALPFTETLGTLVLNGQDTFNASTGSAFTYAGGTFAETGTRRSAGVYGVRNTFNGDLSVINGTTSTVSLSPTLSGNDLVNGNIAITGSAPLTGVINGNGITNGIVTATLSNSQQFAGTLIVTGGQVTIAGANALGSGASTVGGPGGVVLQGEKSVLLFQRGVATAAGEDITIGPGTAFLSGIAVTSYGSGYGTAPAVTVPGGSVTATATSSLLGSSVASVAVSNVGAGFAAAITPTTSGSAVLAPVFGGAIIRGIDQHNVIDGNIILNNVNTSATTGTVGAVGFGIPVLSVGLDDSLQIKGDIYGAGSVTSTANGTRKLTTALLGGAHNSSSGILILSGQVKDVSTGFATGNDILNFEIGGHNELNVQVEKPYNSNGVLQLAQGVLRYTNPAVGANFFASGVTGNLALSVNNTPAGHASVGFNNTTAAVNIQTAAFFLTTPGQTFNAGLNAYLGNSNRIVNDGTNTGYIVIGGENTSGTVTYGTTVTGTTNSVFTLSTDSNFNLRDLRLVANAGGTVEIKGNFAKAVGSSGSISIDKVGAGTVILDGSSAPSALDRTYLLGGVLELGGFATNPTLPRLSTNPSAQSVFGGGTLRVNSAGTAASSINQAVSGNSTLRNGLSAVQILNNGQTVSATFGTGSTTTFTRSAGGVLYFASSGSGASNIYFNNSIARSAPVGYTAFGTATDPASPLRATNFGLFDVNTGKVSAYTGATKEDNVSLIATPNVEENGTGFHYTPGQTAFSRSSLTTVRFTGGVAAGHGVLDLGTQAVSILGGIMVASDAIGDRSIVNGTSLSGSNAGDLILQNWGGAAPKLTVSSLITNSGANANALTIAGDGVTVLTNAANDFKGDVFLSGATLQLSSAAPLGADSGVVTAIKSLQLDGGTLRATDDFAWASRNIVVYGDRSTIAVAPGKTFLLTGGSTGQTAPTLAFTGGLNSQSPEVGTAIAGTSIGYGSASSTTPATGAANIFSGDLIIAGGGNFVQLRDNTANTIAGQMFVQSQTKLSFEGNNFGWLGNNLSWMDGTTIQSGSTLELRPTVNSAGSNTVGEFLHFSGAGQAGSGGALVMGVPTAAANAAAATVDHTISWTGPVLMDGDASIGVADSAEVYAAGLVGMLSFDDTIFDGGSGALTKNGEGILRFLNSRVQNLAGINVLAGEVRFEAGNLGTVGSELNKTQSGGVVVAAAGATASYNNYTTGTNDIAVGHGSTQRFPANPRLSFIDARGTHNANLDLNGGYLFVQSADAPLQSTSFAGDFTLTGPASANGWEAIYVNRVNPVVMFGALKGTGGLTKFGNNEIDFVNPNSSFSGELVIAAAGANVATPSVGLYDGGRFTAATSVRLTNDGTLNLDNQNSLDADTGNDNRVDSAATPAGGRLNNAVTIHLGGAARLRYLGNHAAASTENVGTLALHRGSTAIELAPGAGLKNIGLTFESYQRDAGSVVNFRVLQSGVDFGQTVSDGTANIAFTTAPLASLVGGLGAFGGQDLPVLLGAYGGVVLRDFSSLPANTSLPLALNNNDQMFAGRGFLTIKSVGGVNYLRPLLDTEYLNATTTGARATDTYDFGAAYPATHGAQKNVRLTGGFGPSTSALAEVSFATEGLYTFEQSDDSRKQDSLYRVVENVSFNTLTFAQRTSELVDKGGNRIGLEIQPDKTLTIGSGMILAAGFGVINVQDASGAHNSTQQALIRGGTVEFGSREIIIQNVAAGLNETTGAITNTRLTGTNPAVAGNNLTLSDLSITSTLNGLNGLTKSGSGGVNLGGVNTYQGETNITEGILRLESSEALGASSQVTISGTGELRLQRGIAVGDAAAPHSMRVRFASLAQPSQVRAEMGNNSLFADIQIDALNSAGVRFTTAANPYDVSIVNGTGSFVIGGDIYGLDSSSGGATPLNDVQRGRQSRIVGFQNSGVLQLRGAFRDLQSGAVPSFVTSANEDQVLRAAFMGTNSSNIYLYSTWDAAGSLLLRQGALRLMAGATDFFSSAAANAINPSNAQARPAIGDVGGGEVALLLTTPGQTFNSPTLLVSNNSSVSNVLLGGENTTGTVSFFAPSITAPQYNSANLRVSQWDRNVRLFAASGGTVQVFGRITDALASGGNGSITKLGGGTVVMKGMDGNTPGYTIGTSTNNDFDKQIAVATGTLILDYSVSSATNATIDQTAANVWGSSGMGLTLAGGKLQLRGDSTAAATQNWSSGVFLRAGASELALLPTGTGTLNLNLGSTTVSVAQFAGSTVNFVTSGSAGRINFLITSGVGASGAILAPWATFGSAPGTVTDFVVTSTDGNRTIGALPAASYTTKSDPSQFSAGQFGSEPATGFTPGALTSGLKMLRFGAPSLATTINLNSGFVLGIGGFTDEGAILVPTGTNALKSIAGGDLQVNGGKQLFLHNHGSGGLNVSSTITGASAIVLSGPGVTTFGNNRQSGAVYINEGTLEVSKLNYDTVRTFDVGVIAANQFTFTLPDIADIRTGSTVTGANIAAGTTVLSISGNTISLSNAGATASSGDATITIAPTALTVPTVTFLSGSGNAAVVSAGTVGLAVGAVISGTLFPADTTITSINGTNVGVSQAVSFSGFSTTAAVGVPNGLGLAPTVAGVVINGGTLRYTGPSVLTDRVFTIGDGGATFDVPLATQSMQINGLFASSIAFSGGAANTYAGGVSKTGLGTLIFTGTTSTHSGVTDVKAGVLQFAGSGPSLFGTSTNALDGTVVRGGATLRLQAATSDYATPEWFTFEDNSTLDLNSSVARTVTADGVSNFQGRLSLTYTGAGAGSSTFAFNTNAGFLTGPGTLDKGTVNNGVGGILSLGENSPEWTGGLSIQGGRVLIRSLGHPTGAASIALGTAGVNDLTTSTSQGFPEARLLFQLRDVVNAAGPTSLTGSFDSFLINSNTTQDIVVNRPSDAVAGLPSSQLKQIGVLGNGLSLDQYNLNGDLRLKDDLQFYTEDSITTVQTGEEQVHLNVNGHIISEGTYPAAISTRVALTGRPAGALSGVYNNLYLVLSLNNANPGFTGGIVVGNAVGTDTNGFAIPNADANHILRLNHDLALSAANSVTLLRDATLQLTGHQVTIGSLIDTRVQGTPTVFSGGTTTGYIVAGSREIVENGASAPAQFTVEQAIDSNWPFLIRDGFTSSGAPAGPLSIVKGGPGKVLVGNANSYTGTTSISDGKFLLRTNFAGSGTGTGDVTVSGATFGGTNFTPIQGALTISDDGTRPGILAPGQDRADGFTIYWTLNLSALTFEHQAANGRDQVEFDIISASATALNDLVAATTIAFNAPVDLVLRLDRDSHVFQEGESFRLFVSSSSQITFGTGVNEGYLAYQGQPLVNGSLVHGFYVDQAGVETTQPFDLQYVITAQEIRLNAVPEPGAGLVLACGSGLLLGLRRRRQSSPRV